MTNDNALYFKSVIDQYRALLLQSRDAVGLIAVELFKQSFKVQGQIMGPGIVYDWERRGLVQPSRRNDKINIRRGRLQRSINYKKQGKGTVTIVSDTPYSQIQNDGGKIKVTAKMRRFFFAMVYQYWQRGVSYDIATRQLKQTKRNMKMGEEAEFWLKLALAKEITINAKPFIYDTPELPARIDRFFLVKIARIIEKTP